MEHQQQKTIRILVSACLLGVPCRYDGKSKPNDKVIALQKSSKVELIPVCPEQMGGLPTPRPASEIQADRSVRNREGADVTAAYRLGAECVLQCAKQNGCRLAILKEKSPACGSGLIYDGSFSGKLISGDGICTALLRANQVQVLGESAPKLDGLLEKDSEME